MSAASRVIVECENHSFTKLYTITHPAPITLREFISDQLFQFNVRRNNN